MQGIQAKRSKYKKSTRTYVQDNLLDIIDIEETLSKNRYIEKVEKSLFFYAKLIPKYEAIKPQSVISQSKYLKIMDKINLYNNKRNNRYKNNVINSSNNKKNKNGSKKENKKNKPDNKNKKENKEENEEKEESDEDDYINELTDSINFDILNKNKFNIKFNELKLEYKNGYKVLFIQEYYPLEIIGAGSFGLVVNVIQIKTKQKMAVKIIDKLNVEHMTNMEYLNNEVYILSILNNPHIMKIYDLLDNKHYFFIFMELIEGGNLKDLIIKRYIDKSHPYLFRDSECSIIMKGILEALDYLHKKNIIHRDIKPENIMFKIKDDLSSVTLCDFGLSYQLSEFEKSVSGSCGTIIYMAPEILLKKSYDILVDSFSAGIVLFILCSGGMHPFYTKGMNNKEYLNKLLQYKGLCNFSTQMPLLARNLFLKLCKFEPILRYGTYRALKHPWITRSTSSEIPMTLLEEYSKFDKIKTFKCLLSSFFILPILKRYLNIKQKHDENESNTSIDNICDKTSARTANGYNHIFCLNEKFPILSTESKNREKYFIGNKSSAHSGGIANYNIHHYNIEGKKTKPKKLGLVNAFNYKKSKNFSHNKRIDQPLLSKSNHFVKTGLCYNINYYNFEIDPKLRTRSSNETNKFKENQKLLAIKTPYKQMNSNGSYNSNNIHNIVNTSSNLYNNLNSTKNANSCSKNKKIILKSRIAIKSKNKNPSNILDNNVIEISNNTLSSRYNNDEVITNNIQLKDINNDLRHLNSYQIINNRNNILNQSKVKSNNLVLKDFINNKEL